MPARLGHAVVHELQQTDLLSGTVNGDAYDARELTGEVKFMLDAVDPGGASLLLPAIQHSDNGVDGWASIINFTGISDPANEQQQQVYDADSLKRYIRSTMVYTAGSSVAGITMIGNTMNTRLGNTDSGFLLDAGNYSGSIIGNIVDVRDFTGEFKVILSASEITSNFGVISLEHSDNGVDDWSTIGTFQQVNTSSRVDQIFTYRIDSQKRYIRIVGNTVIGNFNGSVKYIGHKKNR